MFLKQEVFVDILKVIGLGLLVIATAIFILFICSTVYHFFARRIIANQYEWLDVLNDKEWKNTEQMKEAMAGKKRTTIGSLLVFGDIANLEDEELVDCKTVRKEDGTLSLPLYKLTPAGMREKNNRQLTREIDSCSSTA